KLDDLSFDDLNNVYDVHALHLPIVGNALTNESRIMAKETSYLKDEVIGGARGVEGYDKIFKRYRKALAEEVESYHPFAGEVEHLRQKCHDLGKEKHALDIKDIDDYDPQAKKNFDEAREAFYKVEFPYVSMLVERVGQNLGELAAMEPPIYQEAISAPPS
nr:hypothetical protein [Tanacetum cinerariifolium]